VALAVATASNTLLNGFVYDDHANILQNPWIRDFGQLTQAFRNHVAAFDPNANTSFYRPLMHVLYAGALNVFGLVPWGFHLVNLALHAANSACVYILLSRFSASSAPAPRSDVEEMPWKAAWPAALGAALFAVHPIHSEPVAWLAGITDLSYSLFVLAALLVASAPDATPTRRLLVAPVLFALGMLSKEPAIVLLPILAVALGAGGALRDVARRRAVAATLAAHAAAAAGYLLVRAWALGGFAGTDRRVDVDAPRAVATGLALLGEYAKKLVLPVELSAMYDFGVVTQASDPRLWIGVTILVMVVAAAVRLRRVPGVPLGLALLLFPLLPTLYLPALGEGLFAERYLYLPSAGAALLVALALRAIAARAVLRNATVAASCVAVLVLGVSSFDRNAVWRSDLTLWEDTAPKVPRRAGAQEALGTALYQVGRHEEAAAHLGRALGLNPALDGARVNLAASLCVLGRLEEAADHLRLVLERRPDHPEAHAVLGWALMAGGQVPEAIAAYERALAIKPNLAPAHHALGVAYAQFGDLPRAARHLREAARLDPGNPEYVRNLAAIGR
jgi:Flp pilus assembly protein TadD